MGGRSECIRVSKWLRRSEGSPVQETNATLHSTGNVGRMLDSTHPAAPATHGSARREETEGCAALLVGEGHERRTGVDTERRRPYGKRAPCGTQSVTNTTL